VGINTNAKEIKGAQGMESSSRKDLNVARVLYGGEKCKGERALVNP